MPIDTRDRYTGKCPNCGNPVYPNQTHCSFCGCELPPLPPPGGTLDWREKQEAKEAENEAELEQQKNGRQPPSLERCSLCGQKSVFYNEHNKTYECLNPHCQARGKTLDTLFSWKSAIKQKHKEQSAEKVKQKEFTEREQTQTPRKATSTTSGRAWFGNEYFDSKSKTWKTPRRKVSLRKFFLVLFTLACLVAAVWAGYLLFTHQIEQVAGIIILLADIGVLIWNVSVLRSYRWRGPSFGKMLAVFLVSALVVCSVCAFAGIQPLASYKDDLQEHARNFLPGIRAPDIIARVMGEGVVKKGISYEVPVELTPSDTVELRKVNCVELLSSEGYSFGREFVYWTDKDSRKTKTVAFYIPIDDKVGKKVEKLYQAAWAKFLSGDGLESIAKWEQTSLDKILKVRITKVELAAVESIYTENLSSGGYRVYVRLIPSVFVNAHEDYKVELRWMFEDEYRYLTRHVSWTRPQLDSQAVQEVCIGNVGKHFWEDYVFTVKVFPAD